MRKTTVTGIILTLLYSNYGLAKASKYHPLDYSSYESCYEGIYPNEFNNVMTVCFSDSQNAYIHMYYPNKHKSIDSNQLPVKCSESANISTGEKGIVITGMEGGCSNGRALTPFKYQCKNNLLELDCAFSIDGGEMIYRHTMKTVKHNKSLKNGTREELRAP